MGIDKQFARAKKKRIPEKTLWKIAWFGGAIGMWIGMLVFRHKTKHLSFKLGLPSLSIIWLVLLILLVS